jgi:hypothetical protein
LGLSAESRSPLWQIAAHGVAFCVAAGIGAFLIYPLHPVVEAETETANEAFGAFLTCVVTIGGVGPAITLVLFWLLRLTRRIRLRTYGAP